MGERLSRTAEAFGKLLVRLGLGLVFLVFGVDKFIHPLEWVAWIPEQLQGKIPLGNYPFLYFQGVAEAILGFGLILGFLTRLCALVCLVILAAILWFFGLNQVLVRDLGLMGVAAALFVFGPGAWSLDHKLRTSRRINGSGSELALKNFS